MFPGCIIHPDCHLAGPPAQRAIVMKRSDTWPQSPCRFLSTYSGMFSMVEYSLALAHGKLLSIHSYIFLAFRYGLLSSPIASFTAVRILSLKRMCCPLSP